MSIRVCGFAIAFAALMLCGTVNTSLRPPDSIPLWAFGIMLGLVTIASVLQGLVVRSRGPARSLVIAKLIVAFFPTAALFVGAGIVGATVERLIAPAGVGWADSVGRGLWFALAALCLGLAVTPGAICVSTDEVKRSNV